MKLTEGSLHILYVPVIS